MELGKSDIGVEGFEWEIKLQPWCKQLKLIYMSKRRVMYVLDVISSTFLHRN